MNGAPFRTGFKKVWWTSNALTFIEVCKFPAHCFSDSDALQHTPGWNPIFSSAFQQTDQNLALTFENDMLSGPHHDVRRS